MRAAYRTCARQVAVNRRASLREGKNRGRFLQWPLVTIAADSLAFVCYHGREVQPQDYPMSWLSRLAERQIQRARLRGDLQGLAGEGKPLPDRPGDAFVSAGDAIGFRIMAEAGVLPEEIIIKKQAAAQRALLATVTNPALRKVAMAELARLEMRQAIAEEARRLFMKG